MIDVYGLVEVDGSMVRGKRPPQGVGSYIADCFGSSKYASRIVACVNACTEISNEALEDVAFRKTELEKLGELRELSTDKASEKIIDRHDAEILRAAAEDIAFLLARAGCAGKCSFTGDRWTGLSSNYIVSIAYGEEVRQELPYDKYDLLACERTYDRLPEHRKTDAVLAAMKNARAAIMGEVGE